MLTKRIVPCLDIRDGKVVKGMNFEGIRDVADPVEMAAFYNESGADELVFYDITATFEGRKLFSDVLEKVASQIFIPLTVGGGSNTLEDFDRLNLLALRLEDGVYLLLRTALAPEEGVRTGEGTESLRSLAARGLARRELGETAGSLERVFRPEWKRIRMDLLFRQDLN